MSIFNTQDDAQPQAGSEEHQATDTNEGQQSFVKQIVAERGETWADPEVIAKGKIEADNHIKSLEAQLAEMREDLSKQDYSAQLLKQLQDKAVDPTSANPAGDTEESGTVDPLTGDDNIEEKLASLVEKTLTDREVKATVKQNIDLVDNTLTEKYGAEANDIVAKKVKELGLTMSRMEELAAESPTAFMALLGEPAPTKINLTQGDVQSEAVGQQSGGARDWKYYQDLRRNNRSLYYNPKTQQQMMEDKQRLGDKFGNL